MFETGSNYLSNKILLKWFTFKKSLKVKMLKKFQKVSSKTFDGIKIFNNNIFKAKIKNILSGCLF